MIDDCNDKYHKISDVLRMGWEMEDGKTKRTTITIIPVNQPEIESEQDSLQKLSKTSNVSQFQSQSVAANK